MRSGVLRKRVTLQAESRTDDGAGGYALSWTDVATVWAEIAPLGGREAFAAHRLEARVTHRVRLRYREGITADMRLVMGSRVFNIRAVLNEGERNRWLDLLAEEGVAA